MAAARSKIFPSNFGYAQLHCLVAMHLIGEEEFAMKARYLRTVLLLGVACAAFGDTVVVPVAQATTAGNAPVHLGTTAVRVQEVIGSGQFAGPITINALRVRVAPGTGS